VHPKIASRRQTGAVLRKFGFESYCPGLLLYAKGLSIIKNPGFPDGNEIVTNRDIPGIELIHWYRERCGKSEEVHAVMKDDLASGKLRSGDFGENAAWWGIMILTLNLHSAMKRMALPAGLESKRLKAVRFRLIYLAGQVRMRSRQLEILLSPKQPALSLLLYVRKQITNLARGTPEAVALGN